MDINTIGKIGELEIMTMLLKKGFSVFQNVNDIDGVDLIIKKENKFITLQIKNASKTSQAYKGLYERYAYRITKLNVDFIICIASENVYIIPSNILKCKAIFIYPTGKKKGYTNFKNKWELLENHTNLS